MLGHFTVDMFGGLLPILYPLMAAAFNLNLGDVGLIALSYTAASSLSQPLFGFVADRYGSRYLAPASLVWAAIMFGLVGFAPNVGILALFAALAGLGSGAYHPQGAANASAVTGAIQKNTAMSFYTVGGTSGYALGPILGAIVFGIFGRQGSILIAPFGFISAFLVLRSFKRLGLGLPEAHHEAKLQQRKIRWKPLIPILSVSMLRNLVMLSVVTFVPLWYRSLGYSAAFYGVLTSLMIAGGAVGAIFGGLLADRLGQRRVLIAGLALSVPALIIFVLNPGPGALILGPLFGMLGEGPVSITLGHGSASSAWSGRNSLRFRAGSRLRRRRNRSAHYRHRCRQHRHAKRDDVDINPDVRSDHSRILDSGRGRSNTRHTRG